MPMPNMQQTVKHVDGRVYYASTDEELVAFDKSAVTGVVKNAVVVNSQGEVDKYATVYTTVTGDLVLLHTF